MGTDTSPTKQLQNLNRLVGVGLTLAAFVLYIFTLAPTVLKADGGEFQFVPWLPGIAHPTGYPLYVLLGWLWTHLLPVGEVAWRMNLLSAVFAAIAVGTTYAVAHRVVGFTFPHTPVLARILAAAISAATFAVTPTFWGQAIIAEVYALHALFVAAILGLTLNYRREQAYSLWPGVLLAFTFGLGLTHHSTTVLLLPGLILYFWVTRPSKASGGHRVYVWIIYALALLMPLLLYLSLPLVAPLTPYTTLVLSDTQTLVLYENSLPGFIKHITGAVFAGELQPAALGVERLLLPLQLLQQQTGWVGIVLVLIGLFTLWRQRHLGLLLLTGITALTFITFNLIYFIGDVFVLFIPVWLIVCAWLGVGVLAFSRWIVRGFVRHKMGSKENTVFGDMWERLNQNMVQLALGIVLLFFFALPVTLLVTTMPKVNQSNNTEAREQWLKILQEPTPQSAILLSNDRNEIMPMWYYQYVEGIRPDLIGLFPLIVADPAYANVGRVLDQALISGRPVYFIKAMDGLDLKANIKPEGTLFRARPYVSLSPEYTQVVTWPEITLLGYDVSAERVFPGDEITVTLYWQPNQKLNIDYTSYIHVIAVEGQLIAQNDHRPGGNYYSSSYWQPGEILKDRHVITLADDVIAGLYQLRVGMYYQPEPGVIISMGNEAEIGQITVKDCC